VLPCKLPAERKALPQLKLNCPGKTLPFAPIGVQGYGPERFFYDQQTYTGSDVKETKSRSIRTQRIAFTGVPTMKLKLS